MRNYILILALIFSGFTHAQIFDFGCPSSPLEGEQRMLRAAGFSDTVTSTLPEAVPGYVFQHTDGRWIEYTDSEDGTPWTTSRGGDFATAAEALAYLNSLGGALPPGGLQGYTLDEIIDFITGDSFNPPTRSSGKTGAFSARTSCDDERPSGQRIDLQFYDHPYRSADFLIIRSGVRQPSEIPAPTISLVRSTSDPRNFRIHAYSVSSTGTFNGADLLGREVRGETLSAMWNVPFTYILRLGSGGGTLDQVAANSSPHEHDIQLACSDFSPPHPSGVRLSNSQSGCVTPTMPLLYSFYTGSSDDCSELVARHNVCNYDSTDTVPHYYPTEICRSDVSYDNIYSQLPADFSSNWLAGHIDNDPLNPALHTNTYFRNYRIEDTETGRFAVDAPNAELLPLNAGASTLEEARRLVAYTWYINNRPSLSTQQRFSATAFTGQTTTSLLSTGTFSVLSNDGISYAISISPTSPTRSILSIVGHPGRTILFISNNSGTSFTTSQPTITGGSVQGSVTVGSSETLQQALADSMNILRLN